MQLTFLAASEPLTKNYEKRPDGSYVGGMYPGVTKFTSHVKEVGSIAQFAECLETHANMGHCLLTNSLTKQIENEPRRELSDKNERREWILLDIDGMQGITSVEDFVTKVLPTPFHDASYVVQHSPSSGIKPGIRVHVFFMLYDSIDPRQIESWLAEINLTNDLLSNQVTLSKSNLALSYPLDRVASRNGRIVYITPPTCDGFVDPISNRIEYVNKKHDRVSFTFSSMSPTEIARKVRKRVNELRSLAGLKISRKEEHIRINQNGQEILDDSLVEQGIITSWREDNERFMRCNVNGGDSYAYFFHRDQDDPYIHNFKGEPAFRLRLFDPQFYADHVRPHFEKLQKNSPRPFVFHDKATDKWFAGLRKDKEIIEQPNVIGSKDKIENYFSFFGTSPPMVIPEWDRLFDPSLDDQWYPDKQVFNTWRPTEYQQHTLGGSIGPTIDKILRHVTGDDEEAYEHFLNWLAYIQQRRTKPGTAWILHGIPGTGKGLLFHYIIRPIFGKDYCVTKQLKDLKDRFNGWMEQAIFCNIDEANSDDISYEGKEVVNALKNWITEPTISVRQMQATAVNRPSFINFIFTTNDFGILPIQDGDRRFNVAPRQTKKLIISEKEINGIDGELHSFAAYLNNYKVNPHEARTPLENEAKAALKQAARSSIEEFFHAALEGDLLYFADGTYEQTTEYGELAVFKEAVENWIDDARNDRETIITVEDMKAAHVVMCRDKNMKLSRFISMVAKRGFPAQKIRLDDGERVRGWNVEWKLTDEQKRDLKVHLKAVPSNEDLEGKIRNEIERD